MLFETQDASERHAYVRRLRAEGSRIDWSAVRLDALCGRLKQPTTYRLSLFVPNSGPGPGGRRPVRTTGYGMYPRDTAALLAAAGEAAIVLTYADHRAFTDISLDRFASVNSTRLDWRGVEVLERSEEFDGDELREMARRYGAPPALRTPREVSQPGARCSGPGSRTRPAGTRRLPR